MSEEVPVVIPPSKKPRTSAAGESTDLQCIIHYQRHSADPVCKLTDHAFDVIKKAADLRQQQDDSNWRLDGICENIPSLYVAHLHGRHEKCYKSFTNTSYLKSPQLKEPVSVVDNGGAHLPVRCSARTASRTITSSSVLFPSDQCLFCDKGRKFKKGIEDELVKCVTVESANAIQQSATEKDDCLLLGKIAGLDLVAREAVYHTSCRRNYTRQLTRTHHRLSDSIDEVIGGTAHRKASKEGYEHVFKYVDKHVFYEGSVVRMNMLKNRYLDHIQEHAPQFFNENFHTDKLKSQLINHYAERLKFWKTASGSELVYKADVEVGAAVEMAFESASSEQKIYSHVAKSIRRKILQEESRCSEMPWPPSADFLQSDRVAPPDGLTNFIQLLLTGKSRKTGENTSDKTRRLAASIAEDICAAVTGGKWKMRKHLLLGLSVHHLTGSAQIVTMLNRYGHCCSYPLVRELETAMAVQVETADTVLPFNISQSGNVVANLCWDNFDLVEETPSGADTTHSTHGILIQEATSNCTQVRQETYLPRNPTLFTRSFLEPLRVCYTKKRVEPVLLSCTASASDQSQHAASGDISQQPSGNQVSEVMWVTARANHNEDHTVPGWNGWVSATASQQDLVHKSVIGYMAPILHPITQYATVQTCILKSIEACRKLKQPYTLITMDLAAAKIAFDIKWNEPSKYDSVIINLGAFHIMMSYMGAIGKLMTGTGFEEIIIESGICASGSIVKVLSGKHYNRALRVHQVVLEALEQLLLTSFSSHNPQSSVPDLQHVARKLSPNSVTDWCVSEEMTEFARQCNDFKDQIRSGLLGETAKLWLSYMDCIWHLIRFHRAVKENDLDSYISSMRHLCNLMFSADHVNYARYLSMHYHQLVTLCDSHPGALELLRANGFSVAQSTTPGARCAIDLTIEQTINRSAKCSGGIVGFSRKPTAYYKWCITRHTRAAYLQAALHRCDMTSDSDDVHKALRPSEIKASARSVQRVVEAFSQYQNPFKLDDSYQTSVICISSGKPACSEVASDLCRYISAGQKAANDFIQARLIDRSVAFHSSVKKLNLKTFHSMSATTTVMTARQKKSVEVNAERNLFGQLLLLSQMQDVDLEKVFQYQLGPIPWSLATSDGGMAKTNKAQLMHYLESKVTSALPSKCDECIHVVDGNAVIQSCVSLPETFGELSWQIFHCLPKSSELHFVTDCYHDSSIKSFERHRRGDTPQYSVGGPKTKVPRDFKTFLCNPENKVQLISLLCDEWQTLQYAPFLQNRKLYFVCGEQCMRMESMDGLSTICVPIPDLHSSQEEADTRVVLHCKYASQLTFGKSIISVRSPDTDVLIILLAHCNTISSSLLFDTGTGNNRRVVDVTKLSRTIGSALCQALPFYHALTGCDFTSAFVRRGKVKPLQILERDPQFLCLFQSLGCTTDISNQQLTELERFVCAMYGKCKYSKVNKLRLDMFMTRYEPKPCTKRRALDVGIDLSLMPPCKSSLEMHVQRSNYVAFLWKQAHIAHPQMPSATDHGWKYDDEGHIAINWTKDDILPPELLEAVSSQSSTDQDVYDELDEDYEIDNILDIAFESDSDD